MGQKGKMARKLPTETEAPPPSRLTREKYYGHEYERDLLHGIEIKTSSYIKDLNEVFWEMAERNGWTDQEAKDKVAQNLKERGLVYLDFPAAIKLVKKNQPWNDPTEPDPNKSRFGHDLRSAIVEELDLSPEQAEKVRFFVATSREKKSPAYYKWADARESAADLTPLDYYHGTDCFIEIGGKKDELGAIVLIDITLNRQKRNAKALVVPEIDIPETNSEAKEVDAYYGFIEHLARQVISRLPKGAIKQLEN